MKFSTKKLGYLVRLCTSQSDFYSEMKRAAKTRNSLQKLFVPEVHTLGCCVGIRVLSCPVLSFVIGCYERLLS